MDIPVIASDPAMSLLPEKSRGLYEKTYEEFLIWCEEMKTKEYTESVLLDYFSTIVEKGLIASLWPKYSMLRANLSLKQNIDISKYNKLIAYIKRQKEGYQPKKSKVLERDHVIKFITDAPDEEFLMAKVVLILGIGGAMRKDELLKLQKKDVQDLGTKFLITIKARKNKTNRIFTIVEDRFLNFIRKYISLRPKHTPHERFFIGYRNSRCNSQPVGINTFSKIPSKIAQFLNLEDAHLYTGHCFRRSAACILADTGTDFATIKKIGAWKPAWGKHKNQKNMNVIDRVFNDNNPTNSREMKFDRNIGNNEKT